MNSLFQLSSSCLLNLRIIGLLSSNNSIFEIISFSSIYLLRHNEFFYLLTVLFHYYQYTQIHFQFHTERDNYIFQIKTYTLQDKENVP